MKNGTLVIHNSVKLQEEIYQNHEDFDKSKWSEMLDYQVDILQKLYDELCKTDRFGGGCEELYVLGDVINLLNAIDIKLKE